MESTIHSRITELVNYERGQGGNFSKKTGIAASTLSTIKKGLSKPSFEVMKAICLAYEDLNVRWLITGEGSKFFKEYPFPDREDFDKRLEKLEEYFEKYEEALKKLKDEG